MDRKSKSFFSACCLTLLYSITSHSASLLPTEVGKVTQSFGTTTFLSYAPASKIENVKKTSALMTKGSYLTRDKAFLTAKLFDSSWLRASPNTKFSLELDQKNKEIIINLFTGSIKAMFSTYLNKSRLQKMIFKGSGLIIEASEAKFSVIRFPVLKTLSIYVEKGVATVINGRQFQNVHAMEMITFDERKQEIPTPRKMDDKELSFLHGKVYLKGLKVKGQTDHLQE